MTMYDDYCTQQRSRADAYLAAFLEANCDFAVPAAQVRWLKGTHLVAFGDHCGRPAVFKYYDGDPRKEYEKEALHLFEPTGLVPRIFAETDLMLVMERLPGMTLHAIQENLGQAERDEIYFSLGQAVARLVDAAPGEDLDARHSGPFHACATEDFYNTPYDALVDLYRQADTATFFDTTLARAARVLHDRDMPYKQTLQSSLAALTQDRDAILARPHFIQMDDFHANNIMAEGTRITGFIDLEMTRCGNEILLLAAALSSMSHQPECWSRFRHGYEAARRAALSDQMLSLIRAAASFSTWIRFTWYWSTDALPWWAKEADLRTSAVRAIKGTVEAIEAMQP